MPHREHRSPQVFQPSFIPNHAIRPKLRAIRITRVPSAASLIAWAAYLPELAAKLTD